MIYKNKDGLSIKGLDAQMATETTEALCHGQEDFHAPIDNNIDKGIQSIFKVGEGKSRFRVSCSLEEWILRSVSGYNKTIQIDYW